MISKHFVVIAKLSKIKNLLYYVNHNYQRMLILFIIFILYKQISKKLNFIKKFILKI